MSSEDRGLFTHFRQLLPAILSQGLQKPFALRTAFARVDHNKGFVDQVGNEIKNVAAFDRGVWALGLTASRRECGICSSQIGIGANGLRGFEVPAAGKYR